MEQCDQPISNCTFSLEQRKIVGILGSVAAFVSTICCLFTLFLILVFKKYTFSTQRVVLYLIVCVLLYSASRLALDGSSSVLFDTCHINLCISLAFLTQYFATCALFAIACIIVDYFNTSILLRKTRKLEYFYPVVIFVISAVIASIPLPLKMYGPTRISCTIQDISPVNCTRKNIGLALNISLWWAPIYLVILLGFLSYVIGLCFLRKESRRYKAFVNSGQRDVYETVKNENKYLQWYPLLFMIIEIVPIIDAVYAFFSPTTLNFPLAIIAHIITGLIGGIVTIVFTLDPHTRKRLKYSHLRAAFVNSLCRKRVVEEYPILPSNITDSLQQ